MAIFHSFYHIEYATVAKVLKKRNIPFFIEPHGSFGHNAMKKGWLKKFLADHTVFRSLIKDATGYIFTNIAEEKDTVYIPKQSSVIPNGVIENVARKSADKTVKSLQNPIFYFLGRYDIHHKGLDYLFDALKILDEKKENLTIRLYGTGNDEQIKYVRDRIASYTHINVKDMGTIYGKQKKKALEYANILVLTSRYEGSPMTILDGLCYGNPCLVTPGTNIADEAVEKNIGWKTSPNAQDIAESFLRAREEYKIWGTEYIKRCKDYVLENYTWSRMAALSISEYKRMLNK